MLHTFNRIKLILQRFFQKLYFLFNGINEDKQFGFFNMLQLLLFTWKYQNLSKIFSKM